MVKDPVTGKMARRYKHPETGRFNVKTKRTLAEQKARTSWAGADAKISKARPKPFVVEKPKSSRAKPPAAKLKGRVTVRKVKPVKVEPVTVRPVRVEPRRARTLAKVERGIAGGERETAVVVDRNGVEVVRRTGGRDAVTFTPDELSKMSGGTLTHNHPSTISQSGLVLKDIPPSGQDAALFLGQKLEELRAVAQNYVYSLKLRKGLPRPSLEELVKKWEQRRAAYQKQKTIEVSSNFFEGKISEVQAKGEIFTYQSTAYHRAWLDVADEFGIDYVWVKL